MIFHFFRRSTHRLALCCLLINLCWPVSAQTPTTQTPQTPPSNPAQRDATRPPITQQSQPVPEQARPMTQDPTAPPNSQRSAPQAPPGTGVSPQTVPQAPVTGVSGQTASPSTVTPATPPTQTPITSGDVLTTPGADQTLRDPAFPNQQARPVPPLPNLTRLGIKSDATIALTLNEAIRRALENNNDIEVARTNVRFAETSLRALQGIYDPVFSIAPQIDYRVQPQANRFAGAGQSGTVSFTNLTLSPTVTKFFQTGGGRYDFFFNNTRQTTNSTANIFNPVYSANLGVTFTQPLFRDRSIDSNRREIRIQRKRLAQTDADFRRQTIEVIAQVQRAYWDLTFALRNQQNLISNLNLSREQFRQTEARIAAGALPPLERAQVQTELANRESDLLLASQNVSIAENNLKQLILRDVTSPDWSASLFPTDEPTFDSTPVNLTDALTEARANRPELSRLRLQRDINDIDLKFFKNQTHPRIDIQSTISTTGQAGTPVLSSFNSSTPFDSTVSTAQLPLITGDPSTNASAFLLQQINAIRTTSLGLTPVDSPLVTSTQQSSGIPSNLVGGYGQTLSNLFGLKTRNIVVGVTIQMPFRNKTAQANLAGAQIQRTQLDASMRQQEQTVEVDVRNAAQNVETARRRVLSARAARESAEVQLAGERRLNEVGRSTTFFLFQRENELANARFLEIRAETDYNKALADLQRATSTTLRANNIIVETSSAP
jgi:HAE1 family hydrophobic/amphiphilic exporter-1